MRKLVLAAVLVLMAGGAQAATLNVVGGQLMGASGVLVDGSLYDVQFLDGTCIDLYSGSVGIGPAGPSGSVRNRQEVSDGEPREALVRSRLF